MLKAFKYRLTPTKKQAELINKHIGSCRFVYNLALEVKKRAYNCKGINLSIYDLQKQLPELKKECIWLNEIGGQSLQVSIHNLDTAFKNFFKGRARFPKFKKKTDKLSFNVPQYLSIKNNILFIPKFREGIPLTMERPIVGTIKQANISRTPTGKYFASILCETGEENKPKQPIKRNTTIGIDLGIKSFLVTSEGNEIDNPRYLKKSLKRLIFIQRRYSKYKGKRRKHKLAKLHEKVANQRKDFLHKTSSHLIKNHDSIAIEDLNVSGMVKMRSLSQAISDVGWGTFVSMLEYKSAWYGKNILTIGRFEPSSKTCSECGGINHEITLKDREWVCNDCGSILDRDINAAINIKNFALKNHLSVERRLKNQKELPSLEGVLTSEALIFG